MSPGPEPQGPQLDHLVVAAHSLAQGVQWCQGVLGVTPGAGGVHPLMGTHNRLALLSGGQYPACYLEIIAIDPDVTPQKPADQARWFGLDEPALQTRLQQSPQLVHWVARVPNLANALATCAAHGVHPGEAVRASRPTAQGLLSWDISVPHSGRPAAEGLWPTLIAWGEQHPCTTLPASGLALTRLELQHPGAASLNALWRDLGGAAERFTPGPAQLKAQLATPRGAITLCTAL